MALPHGCSPSRGVPALAWTYSWPHALRHSSLTSCTATDASRCACCRMNLSIDTDASRCVFSSMVLPFQRYTCCGTDITMTTGASRCTCSSVDLLTATDALGCPAPIWTHLQVTVPLTRAHRGVPACPVQPHRNSSDAPAICQPRHIAIAVTKMFPGTAE